MGGGTSERAASRCLRTVDVWASGVLSRLRSTIPRIIIRDLNWCKTWEVFQETAGYWLISAGESNQARSSLSTKLRLLKWLFDHRKGNLGLFAIAVSVIPILSHLSRLNETYMPTIPSEMMTCLLFRLLLLRPFIPYFVEIY